MTTSTTVEHDHELQDAVERELHWVPEVDAAEIDVAVDDGIVTLSGHVPSYAQKIAAGSAAFRTRTVRGVENELHVHYPGDEPSDAEIAASVRAALAATDQIPGALVEVAVTDGVVTLTGEVMWNFERAAAVEVVSGLSGVRGLVVRIGLTSRAGADVAETERLIHDALRRHAMLDAAGIHVQALGDTVELTGTVSSWDERHQAELAAWSSPHVENVRNAIQVRAS